jgi:hypothetical protein
VGLNEATGGSAGAGMQTGAITAGFRPPQGTGAQLVPAGPLALGGGWFESFNAAEVEATAKLAQTPLLLAPPDRISFVVPAAAPFTQGVTVQVFAEIEAFQVTAKEKARVTLFVDGAEAFNNAGAAIKCEESVANSFQLYRLFGEAMKRPSEETTPKTVASLLGIPLVLTMTPGEHSVDLRVNGEASKYQNRRVLVKVG